MGWYKKSVIVSYIPFRAKSVKKLTNKFYCSKELLRIYNYALPEKFFTWGNLMDYVITLNKKYPISGGIGLWFIVCNTSRLKNSILQLFLHTIPAYMIHGLLVLLGQQPK